MTLGHSHDTPLGHKQSLCEVRTNVSPYKRYRADTNYKLFLPNDLYLAQITFGQNDDTPSGHKLSLCEVKLALKLHVVSSSIRNL